MCHISAAVCTSCLLIFVHIKLVYGEIGYLSFTGTKTKTIPGVFSDCWYHGGLIEDLGGGICAGLTRSVLDFGGQLILFLSTVL